MDEIFGIGLFLTLLLSLINFFGCRQCWTRIRELENEIGAIETYRLVNREMPGIIRRIK